MLNNIDDNTRSASVAGLRVPIVSFGVGGWIPPNAHRQGHRIEATGGAIRTITVKGVKRLNDRGVKGG